MVIAFPAEVSARLQTIEETEGVPPLELVHQAVAVWSSLDAVERRILGIGAMRLVADRLHGGVR